MAFWNQWGGKTNSEKTCPTPNNPTPIPSAQRRALAELRERRCGSCPISGTRMAARRSSWATRLIPVFDGFPTGLDLDPEALEDIRRRAAVLEGAAGIQLADVELVPPIPFPGKVVCVGLNYRDHVAEGGRPAPTRPLLFSKVRQRGHRRR